jgi:hypothetical protein
MSDELFHDVGPEGRNQAAAAFEDQLVEMGDTLGWTMVCRNADLFIKTGNQSRGIDVLWSVWNPRVEERQGWVEEAKSHREQAPSALQSEFQTLHDKVSKLSDSERARKHHHVGPAVKDFVGGIVAHRSNDYKPERSKEALLNLELRRKERGKDPLRTLFFGPDTLEALADAFLQHGKPSEFLWPPTSRHDSVWHRSCPPEQLGLGMLAWKTEDGKVVFWMRDTLVHHDVGAISDIVKAWGINADVVVCSELDRDQWRVVRKQWEEAAEASGERQVGHLPSSVDARNLSYSRMNRFDDLWHAAA